MLALAKALGLLSALSTLPLAEASALKAPGQQQAQLAFQPPPLPASSNSSPASSSPPSTASQQSPLDVSSTANFIFNSMTGILAQLPNTIHPNGHTLLPVHVPQHTTLYHSAMDDEILRSGYEWLAFDPEMSYAIFIRGGPTTFLTTWATTRPLKLLALDGMSSALGHVGWLDSQDVLTGMEVGTSPEEWEEGEEERARRLCAWNTQKKIGLDGFVRTNSGHEILYCDFASDGFELVSHHKISPPDIPTEPGTNPWDPLTKSCLVRGKGSFFAQTSREEWLRSTSHRYLVPQPHVYPDWASFVTFYHPRLTSLVDARKGLARMADHIIKGYASKTDVDSIREEVEEVLRRGEGTGSGVDWGQLGKDVVERYGDRLTHLKLILNPPTSNASSNFILMRRQTSLLTYTLLSPFLDTTYLKNTSDASVPSTFWLPQAVERCSNQLTRTVSAPSLTSQEQLLKASIEIVTARICRDAGEMFEQSLSRNEEKDELVVERWRRKVDDLMDWLDWPMWTICEEVCAWDEVCAIPLWPVNSPWGAPDPWSSPIVPVCKPLVDGWVKGSPF